MNQEDDDPMVDHPPSLPSSEESNQRTSSSSSSSSNNNNNNDTMIKLDSNHDNHSNIISSSDAKVGLLSPILPGEEEQEEAHEDDKTKNDCCSSSNEHSTIHSKQKQKKNNNNNIASSNHHHGIAVGIAVVGGVMNQARAALANTTKASLLLHSTAENDQGGGSSSSHHRRRHHHHHQDESMDTSLSPRTSLIGNATDHHPSCLSPSSPPQQQQQQQHARRPLPKALPDVDDVAMSNVVKYIEYYHEDLFWSGLSDSFFIVGGVLYVILNTAGSHVRGAAWYKTFSWLAPTVYLLNSFIDVAWARRVQKRAKIRKVVTETWNDWRILLDADDNEPSESSHPEEGEGDALNTSSNSNNRQQQRRPRKPWWTLCRKHAAHRRTILAALSFGIAALFGVLAVLHNEFNATLSDRFNTLSIHFYIISAVISVSGKRVRPWLSPSSETSCGPGSGGAGTSAGTTTTTITEVDGTTRTIVTPTPSCRVFNPELLEDLGDLLFLVGSVGDGILCDSTFDDGVPGWGILSATLWLIDASLYFCADIVMATRLLHYTYGLTEEEEELGGVLV